MKKYVVVDTNVLVSALITRNENASTVKILRYLSQNKIVSVYSSDIVLVDILEKNYGKKTT